MGISDGDATIAASIPDSHVRQSAARTATERAEICRVALDAPNASASALAELLTKMTTNFDEASSSTLEKLRDSVSVDAREKVDAQVETIRANTTESRMDYKALFAAEPELMTNQLVESCRNNIIGIGGGLAQ